MTQQTRERERGIGEESLVKDGSLEGMPLH